MYTTALCFIIFEKILFAFSSSYVSGKSTLDFSPFVSDARQYEVDAFRELMISLNSSATD